MEIQQIIVYVIVAAAALALAVKIRRSIKNKGKCCGCNACHKSDQCGH